MGDILHNDGRYSRGASGEKSGILRQAIKTLIRENSTVQKAVNAGKEYICWAWTYQ